MENLTLYLGRNILVGGLPNDWAELRNYLP